MIYGKLSLKDWRTARVEGETPESSFESYNFRLFFFGTLYNRDQLQSSPADSNAKLVADAYLADSNYGFSRLDGSFTIVYYSKAGQTHQNYSDKNCNISNCNALIINALDLLMLDKFRIFIV